MRKKLSRLMRLAPYNYELIVFDRWRIPYAPVYGWWHLFKSMTARYRQARLERELRRRDEHDRDIYDDEVRRWH